MRKSIGLVLAATLVSTGAAKPREVRRLAPSSQWVVDYADDSCSLARKFGDGDRQVTLFFDQFEPGDTFSLTMVGKALVPRGDESSALVQFGPNEKPQDVSVLAGTSRDTPMIIVQGLQRIAPGTAAEKAALKKTADNAPPVVVPPIGAAREKAATWFQVGKALPFDLVLDTGPMDEPLAALRTCSWDMVRSWGLDVEQQKQRSMKPYPKTPSRDWFSDNDYPAGMLRDGNQAIVNFWLLINETGKATSCRIQASTRPKEFDDVVCKVVMRHARFHPALDAQGKPIRSFWRQTVTFRIAGF